MWRDYDPAVIERDLGYAARLNLNAIRTWLSYEYWLEQPDAHEKALEHLLDTAQSYGIRVLLGLFDGVGDEPSLENLLNTDPRTAVQVFSPSTRTMKDESLWDLPREYIRRIMASYGDDDRLLALELTNEPGWYKERIHFAKGMVKPFTEYRGSVPLTIGATSLANNLKFMKWNFDVLQFHYNFPESPAVYHRVLREANHIATNLGKPAWLTEWQRIRPGKRFFAHVSGEARFQDYASLAPIIQYSGIGNFFWSLMIKPAYAVRLRQMGVINGLFHEDGAVWSLEDARAIKAMSGDPTFTGTERKQYPKWMADIEQ